MQTQMARTESPRSPGNLAGPKGASPLQLEIDQLQSALETQTKGLHVLREKLAPLFIDEPAQVERERKDVDSIAAVPTLVRDCRFRVENNNAQIEWLLTRLQV